MFPSFCKSYELSTDLLFSPCRVSEHAKVPLSAELGLASVLSLCLGNPPRPQHGSCTSGTRSVQAAVLLLQAKKAMDAGALVSDNLVVGLIEENIKRPDCRIGW